MHILLLVCTHGISIGQIMKSCRYADYAQVHDPIWQCGAAYHG